MAYLTSHALSYASLSTLADRVMRIWWGRTGCDSSFSLGNPFVGYEALMETPGLADRTQFLEAHARRTEMLSKLSTILGLPVIPEGNLEY